MLRTLVLTALAMVAFAANSLLARAALADGAIDAASYTLIRLLAGALVLAAVVGWRAGAAGLRALPGSFVSAAALFAYALFFSLAYLRLGAATGALVLFAAVQGSMILWGMLRRDRPGPQELAGVAVAFAAFAWFLAPGLHAPDPAGAALMTLSGIAWGVYSLRGKGVADPLGATAGNFVRAALLALPLAPLALLGTPFGPAALTGEGVMLAVVSGAVTSGLGYVIWYAALPGLTATQGAVVQLTVPVIAAAGAALLLAEAPTLRLAVASVAILGGVALAILAKRRPAPRA